MTVLFVFTDPKFFDPKYIFKEVALEGPKKMTIFQDPSKQKKVKAEGYKEGDYLQHTVVKATEYLASESPAEVLNECSEVSTYINLIVGEWKSICSSDLEHCSCSQGCEDNFSVKVL